MCAGNVKFYRASTLVNQLSEAKKKGNLSSFLKRFEKLDLLILDEGAMFRLIEKVHS